jgi:hypothetical protein
MKMKTKRILRIICIMSWVQIAALQNSSAQAPAPLPSLDSVPASRIVSPPPAYHLPDIGTYIYAVEWRLLNAGNATVKLENTDSRVHIAATADTSGIVNSIFHVHDIFDADLDPHTFCTLQISKHNEEGKRGLERKVRFDYEQAKSEVDDKNLKTGELKHAEHDIPGCITDVISGFIYVSSLILEPGISQVFPVNDGGKTSDIRIKVESREKVRVPAGTFQTVKLQAEATSGPLQGKGTILVWYSDDSRHVPVQMKSKLGFATLLFQLQKIEPPTSGK